MFYALIIVCGLIWGSFLNVVGLRLPQGKSLLYPPSRCPFCGHPLGARELIPVLGYLWLRGRCRNCRGAISPIYPLVESLTAALFLLTSLLFGWSLEWLLTLLLISLLLAASISDIRFLVIPTSLTFKGALIFTFIRIVYHPLGTFWDYVWGMALGGGILYAVRWLSRGGMGGGDAHLLAMAGMAIGWQKVLLALFLASFMGTLLAGSWWLIRGRRGSRVIPFAPYLAAGVLLSHFWGEELMAFYNHIPALVA